MAPLLTFACAQNVLPFGVKEMIRLASPLYTDVSASTVFDYV